MMRRIFHRFPTVIDLDFEVNRPFGEVLSCLRRLHNTHMTNRYGSDLIKQSVRVQVATNKTGFESLDTAPLYEDAVSEAVDFRITLQNTLLKPEGRVPSSQNSFFLRVSDKGARSECMICKDGRQGVLDAMDLKKVLLVAFE